MVKSFLTGNVKNVESFIEALEAGGPRVWGPATFNRLEEPVFALHPALGEARKRMAGLLSAGASMSGSGSALFGVLETGRGAESLARRVQAATGGRTVVTRTYAP